MKKILIAVSLLMATVVGTLLAEEAGKVDLSKIKCVISGKAINPDAKLEYKKGDVYFCCPGCPSAFTKNKTKYAAKANQQLVATGQYKQKGCPMSGGPVDSEQTVKVAGVEVGFCCEKCSGAASGKEGDEQLNLVFGDKAFEKGFELVKKEK